ncbi:hypothetical protein RB653_007876 [Dictyostelium firmibasis]|uniref:PIPK domain-containing protein n=1 Tax=Dictyostelium firmibasis TaxID=79012 RepID=A0AAN7TV53_9MYCE
MSTVDIVVPEMNPALSESIVFAPIKTGEEGEKIPIIPINAALSESIVFSPLPLSSETSTNTIDNTTDTTKDNTKDNTTDNTTNNTKDNSIEQEQEQNNSSPLQSPNCIDGANKKDTIELEEDKEHSIKRKDGSLGDVVDNEKIIPNSLDSDAPEETSNLNKKSEINIKQVLKNPSFDATNDNTVNHIPQEVDTDKPTTPRPTTTTTTTTTTSTSNKQSNNGDNTVSFDEKFDPNSSHANDDFKASGSSDSPNRVRLNTSQRLKMYKQKSEKRLSHRPKSIKLEHKKNVLGEIIYKGHPSWALMLNIQTGIRNAVGKSMGTEGVNPKTPQQYHTLRKPSEFKRKEDFYVSPKTQRFESAGTAMTNAHSTGAFKFKDYCPNAFRYLRYLFGIDTAEFMVSLCNTLKNGENALRELPTPGKSGSLFFFSHDMKFIIKTIPKDEAKLLRDILPSYLEHIQSNPNSLLPRFFGLYRVKPHSGRQVRFVIMGNLFPTKKKIHERYDLKGSVVGREASVDEKKSDSVTFKDIDFRNRKQKIYLGPGKKQSFIDQIKRDCKLLQSLNIMDYSLLIGIHYPQRENEPPSPSLLRPNLEDSSDFESPSMEQSSNQQRGSGNYDNSGAGRENNTNSSVKENEEIYISAFQQDEGGIKSHGGDAEEHYFLGIIDILMLYSLRKKVEHTYKTLKFGTKQEISSVSPDEYSERFQEFLSTIIE